MEWFFGVLFDCDWKRSFLQLVGRWIVSQSGEWEFIRSTVDELHADCGRSLRLQLGGADSSVIRLFSIDSIELRDIGCILPLYFWRTVFYCRMSVKQAVECRHCRHFGRIAWLGGLYCLL
jgi:hypothetical protein